MDDVAGGVVVAVAGGGPLLLQAVVHTLVDVTGHKVDRCVVLIMEDVVVVVVGVLDNALSPHVPGLQAHGPGHGVHHGGGALPVPAHGVTVAAVHLLDLVEDQCSPEDDDNGEDGHHGHGDDVDTPRQLLAGAHLQGHHHICICGDILDLNADVADSVITAIRVISTIILKGIVGPPVAGRS